MLFLFPFPNRLNFKVFDAVFVQFAGILINRFSIKHWKSWIKYSSKTTMMYCHYQLHMRTNTVENIIRNTHIQSYTHSRECKTNENSEKIHPKFTKWLDKWIKTKFSEKFDKKLLHSGNCFCNGTSGIRLHIEQIYLYLDKYESNFISNLDHISCSYAVGSVGVEHI